MMLISVVSLQVKAATDLKVAITTTLAPFSFYNDQNELQGFNVDVLKAVCKEMQRNCELVPMRFPEVIPALVSGKADIGVANFLKTPERAKKVLFSNPYWRSTSSYIGKPGTVLSQAKLCAIEDSQQLAYVEKQFSKIKTIPGHKELHELAGKGECEAALIPTLQALQFLKSINGSKYTFLGQPLSGNGLGGTVHIAVRKELKTAHQQLNDALDSLMDSGRYEEIMLRYFPFSIR